MKTKSMIGLSLVMAAATFQVPEANATGVRCRAKCVAIARSHPNSPISVNLISNLSFSEGINSQYDPIDGSNLNTIASRVQSTAQSVLEAMEEHCGWYHRYGGFHDWQVSLLDSMRAKVIVYQNHRQVVRIENVFGTAFKDESRWKNTLNDYLNVTTGTNVPVTFSEGQSIPDHSPYRYGYSEQDYHRDQQNNRVFKILEHTVPEVSHACVTETGIEDNQELTDHSRRSSRVWTGYSN